MPQLLGTIASSVADKYEISYLLVAGGGGGGSSGGGPGGGGGGGVLTGTNFEINVSFPYTVSVGAGGVGNGVQGNNTTCFGLTAIGGGGGNGGNGGSGGGAAAGSGAGTGVAGPPRQGYNGGTGQIVVAQSAAGGGGGGAGGAGGNAPSQFSPGAGGSPMTWEGVQYAGGANGGANGGTGTSQGIGPGGGGSCSNAGDAPGNGTGGRIAFKYPDTKSITVGAGLTSTTSTSGGFKITYITSGTGTVTFN